MHRQKSAGELLQEERDAELARKLQDELNTEPAVNQTLPINHISNSTNLVPVHDEEVVSPVMHDGVLDISCPVCTFINSISAPHLQEEYCCEQCHSVLSIAKEYCQPIKNNDEEHSTKFDKKHNEVQYQNDAINKANKIVDKDKKFTLICKECQCLNNIPQKIADAMLCGACYQKLDWTSKATSQKVEAEAKNLSSSSASHLQTSSQAKAHLSKEEALAGQHSALADQETSADCVQESNIAEEERTVQVRCGQCGAINAVKVSTLAKSIQFLCGNCETVNEVALA